MKKLILALMTLVALGGSLSGCQKPRHLTGPDGATSDAVPNSDSGNGNGAD